MPISATSVWTISSCSASDKTCCATRFTTCRRNSAASCNCAAPWSVRSTKGVEMTKRIEDLREHLFATLDALRNEDKPMELDRAKVIAQTVIDSAKAENDFMKITGS